MGLGGGGGGGGKGAQWLSARVLDSRLKSHEFEPHRRHCVVVLEQDTFIQTNKQTKHGVGGEGERHQFII